MSAFFCVLLVGCDEQSPEGAAAPIVERTGDSLILAVRPGLPPYAHIETNSGTLCGMDIDIVKAAAVRLRRPLEIHQMPAKDLLPAVKSHKVDFAIGTISITPEHNRSVYLSIPYAEEGSAFLYRVGETAPTMVRAESLRVGTVGSQSHDFYLTRHGIDPFRYSTIRQARDDLVSQKIDTVFYDRPALAEMARMSGGKLAITPLETREYYGIAVRSDRHDYLEAVNAIIRDVIRERKSK